MSTSRRVQRSDEEHVQYQQSDQRTDCLEDEVAAGLVDDVIERVVSQRRLLDLGNTLQ